MQLDDRSLQRLRQLSAAQVLEELRTVSYAAGGGSDVYEELLEEAVARGLLTWEDVERAEERGGL